MGGQISSISENNVRVRNVRLGELRNIEEVSVSSGPLGLRGKLDQPRLDVPDVGLVEVLVLNGEQGEVGPEVLAADVGV